MPGAASSRKVSITDRVDGDGRLVEKSDGSGMVPQSLEVAGEGGSRGTGLSTDPGGRTAVNSSTDIKPLQDIALT